MPIVLSKPTKVKEKHDDGTTTETPSPPLGKDESPPPSSSPTKPPARSASTSQSENQITAQTPTKLPSTQPHDGLSRSGGFGSPPREMPDIFASKYIPNHPTAWPRSKEFGSPREIPDIFASRPIPYYKTPLISPFPASSSITNDGEPQPFSHRLDSRCQFIDDVIARPSVPHSRTDDTRKAFDASAGGDEFSAMNSQPSYYDVGHKDLDREGSNPFGFQDDLVKRGYTPVSQDGGRIGYVNDKRWTLQISPYGKTYENRNGHLFINGKDAKTFIHGTRPGILLNLGFENGDITVNGIRIDDKTTLSW